MKVIEGTISGVPLIVVDGDLDSSAKRVLHDAAAAVLDGPYSPESLLFDLTDCAFLDSSGLSVLLYVLGRLPARGWLGLIGASGGANRVLTYTGFLNHEQVRFFSSRGDAVASLAREKRLRS